MVRSSLFGFMAASFPNILFARTMKDLPGDSSWKGALFHRYPSIDDAIVAEIVGASHFNLEKVNELVTIRPELARATWDWAFGDWETALGAASHVGRRDIASLLMEHGARPDIFTFAMFGQYEVVKAMIDAMPGVETIAGPHGISLLSHVKAGLRSDYGVELSGEEKESSRLLIDYLDQLGTADRKEVNIEMSLEEKKKYIGDYRYGDGEKDGFTVKLNRRDYLSLGKLGKSGGSLFQTSPGVFSYNGISSVKVRFSIEKDTVRSLTVIEPDLTLKAVKIGSNG